MTGFMLTKDLRPGVYQTMLEDYQLEVLEWRGPEVNVSRERPYVVKYRQLRLREGRVIEMHPVQDRYAGDEQWDIMPIAYIIDEVPA